MDFLNREHDASMWCYDGAIVYAYLHTMHQFSTTCEQNFNQHCIQLIIWNLPNAIDDVFVWAFLDIQQLF